MDKNNETSGQANPQNPFKNAATTQQQQQQTENTDMSVKSDQQEEADLEQQRKDALTERD